MKINQIIESSMSSGSVASIAMPMTTQSRSEIGQGVYGNKKAGNLLKGKATKKPFVNSITEGKMKALQLDLSWPPEGLSDAAFKRKYGKTKDEMRKELKKPSQPVQEETISEEDLIIIPGQAMKRTGFIKHDPDKAENEGRTLKNSLHTIMRVAYHLNDALSDRDNFPEWVSEKIGAVKSNLVNVMDYLISEKEMNTSEMTGGVVAGGVAFEESKKPKKGIKK